MHWLASRVADVSELSDCYCRIKDQRRSGGAVSASDEAAARKAFLAALHELVQQISLRPGVSACFAAQDGLVVDAIEEGVAAEAANFEALAAMAQSCLIPARHAAETLRLGGVRQMLLIGDAQKLIMIELGQMTLGIVSPSSQQLAESLGVHLSDA
jgi:predicted regulator of Ras-like GTPase activity (Roadblock/LC7/MglB family)